MVTVAAQEPCPYVSGTCPTSSPALPRRDEDSTHHCFPLILERRLPQILSVRRSLVSDRRPGLVSVVAEGSGHGLPALTAQQCVPRGGPHGEWTLFPAALFQHGPHANSRGASDTFFLPPQAEGPWCPSLVTGSRTGLGHSRF